jgi:hypothetical protein
MRVLRHARLVSDAVMPRLERRATGAPLNAASNFLRARQYMRGQSDGSRGRSTFYRARAYVLGLRSERQ